MKIPKKYLFTSFLFISAALLTGAVLLNGCKSNNKTTGYLLTGNAVNDGRNLAQIYCTRCHELVPVTALNKDVWHYHILPDMAKYFGIGAYGAAYYKKDGDTSKISLQEWTDIVAYYDKIAPDQLTPAAQPVPLAQDWAGFELKKPVVTDTGYKYTSMVAANPFNHKIYTSDLATRKLYEWSDKLTAHTITELPTEGVNAVFQKDGKGKISGTFSCIGSVIALADFPNGRLVNVDLSDSVGKQTLLTSDLPRPVQAASADFNRDGLTDWVICGQGFTKGGLYVLIQKPDGVYAKRQITEQPGSAQVLTGDFDHDGWTDIMALFGSGDEGLYLFKNDHKGGFIKSVLLRFPPVYGSTSFQLVDLNHDGLLDLIYTSGYNYRNSRILKPYHGLYIYLNQGNWKFKQTYFYPIDGCTRAIAADFDGDGNIDIATTAFFADMQHKPQESFIYFEQDGPLKFKPHAVPISQYGHWMSMDVADYNNDGKPDILLGNYSSGFMFQPGFKPQWNKRLPFIVLENHTGKSK